MKVRLSLSYFYVISFDILTKKCRVILMCKNIDPQESSDGTSRCVNFSGIIKVLSNK